MLTLPKPLIKSMPDLAIKYRQAAEHWQYIRRSVVWTVKNIDKINDDNIQRFKDKVYQPLLDIIGLTDSMREDFEYIIDYLNFVIQAMQKKEMDESYITHLDWVELKTQERINERFTIPAPASSA